MKNEPIPKVGMRNIKTACATALCVLIYYFFDRNPTFACIGSIFGMGTDLQSSKQHGGNRLFGTVIGGALGMALFRFYLLFTRRAADRCCLRCWYLPVPCCLSSFARFSGRAGFSPAE